MMRVVSILALLGALLVVPVYGAPNIQVFNYSSYINSNGMPAVVGEVINHGKEPVKSVEVKANFMDLSGSVIDSASANTAIDLILPGQRSPFMIVGEADYAYSIKSYDLQIVNFARAQDKPGMLEIVPTSEFSDGISEVSVRGEIRNIGSEDATSIKVYATFYDDRGRVVGYGSGSADLISIEPNGKANFEMKVRERVPSVQAYTLFAESDQYSTAPFGVQSISNPSDLGSKVGVSRLSLVDQQGNGVGSSAPGERVWIKSDLKNKLSADQGFIYIVQIKDNNGFPVAINWVDGTLTPNMSFAPSISWVPDEEGVYFAEVFVWHDMENPIPLTLSINTIILLVKG
ncbi:MAG: FxLYD domain-containing protein [Nitrososphaerales archaeon]